MPVQCSKTPTCASRRSRAHNATVFKIHIAPPRAQLSYSDEYLLGEVWVVTVGK